MKKRNKKKTGRTKEKERKGKIFNSKKEIYK